MPSEYTNEIKPEQPLVSNTENQTIMHPRVIGQSARESYTDYANPRIKVIGLHPGVLASEIQKALDSLDSQDGGIVHLAAGKYNLRGGLVIPTGVTLEGDGRDVVQIDFGFDSTWNISVAGSASSVKKNVRLRDLTIQKSANTDAALDISYADFVILDNIRVSNNSGNGVRIRGSQQYWGVNLLTDNNTKNGLLLLGVSDRQQIRYTFVGGISTNNTLAGVELDGTASVGSVANGAFLGQECDSNTEDGFSLGSTNTEVATFFHGCIANGNGAIGFDIDAAHCTFSGCKADSNTGDGFENSAAQTSFHGCTASSNGGKDWDLDSTVRANFIGNSLEFGTSTVPQNIVALGDNPHTSLGNVGGNFVTHKVVHQMRNSTASTLVEGDVVSWAASEDGDEATTTTSAGSDKALGMWMASVASGSYGPVLTEGFTTKLKVDGTTDIALGDYLGTFTTAGIAAKVTSGMAFAIALEAYTANDSNGVIDALLITPRKVGSGGGNFDAVAKQENTTNTDPWTDTLDLQTGWGFIQGNDATVISETVTFPHAFAAAPIVIATALGRHTASPSAIGDFTTAPGNIWGAVVDDITTTSFTITILIETGVTLPSTSYFGYTWQAIGAT